jgi:hypothetical protein
MAFWIGILAGALWVAYTLKTGFYETWAILFNLVISIYLGVHLQPLISAIIPAAADTPYGNTLTVLAVAAASFLLLQGITYVFFTSQLTISFPKLFDVLGAGLLGFLAGFLVWSFVALLLCTTPLSHKPAVKQMCFDSQQTTISYLTWWCQLVDKAASYGDSNSQQVITSLLKTAENKAHPASAAGIPTRTGQPEAVASEPNEASPGAATEPPPAP